MNNFKLQIPDVDYAYNQLIERKDFYVSYNFHDDDCYGCDTTALVWGQMQRFYILNGDHREAYAAIIDEGFNACLIYFAAHISEVNKRSDKIGVYHQHRIGDKTIWL